MLSKKSHHNTGKSLCSSIPEKILSLAARKPVQQLPGGVAEMKVWLIRRYIVNEMSSVGRGSDSHTKRSLVVGFWSSLERHECGLSEIDSLNILDLTRREPGSYGKWSEKSFPRMAAKIPTFLSSHKQHSLLSLSTPLHRLNWIMFGGYPYPGAWLVQFTELDTVIPVARGNPQHTTFTLNRSAWSHTSPNR